MRHRVTHAVALYGLLMLWPAATTGQRGPGGTAEISGTVITTGASAAPVARVLVTVSGGPLKTGRTTITDDQGRFVFRDLPAGSFTIVAARPPYVKTAFGARRPGRPGTPIAVVDGQRAAVTIPLARGAVITGVVRNPGGEPAPGIQIVATPLDGRADPLATPTVTDDRGVYRLFGLPPGQYIVKATVSGGNPGFSRMSDAQMDDILARLRRRSTFGGPTAASAPGRPTGTPSPAESGARSPVYAYAPVYYPGTSDLEQAATVTLAEGAERSAVDFDLQLVRQSTIEGRVTIAGDALPPGTQVTLARAAPRGRAHDPSEMVVPGRVDPSGGFRFINVLPGRYRVQARAMITTPTAPAPASPSQPATVRVTGVFWALADVTVGDDDLAGVALTLQPGLKLTGRSVFDATTLTPPETVQLRLAELSGAAALARSGGGRADGTFEITGLLPGTYTIASPLSDAGWWLRSVVIDGRDVLDFPLELGGSGDVSGAVATFTDRRTELSGTLQTAANTPAPDYFIVVFSADRMFWRKPSRRVQFTRPSTDGRFVFRDLPAGDYLIAAVTDMEAADLGDAAFLEPLISAALKVRLADGEKKTQNLTFAR